MRRHQIESNSAPEDCRLFRTSAYFSDIHEFYNETFRALSARLRNRVGYLLFNIVIFRGGVWARGWNGAFGFMVAAQFAGDGAFRAFRGGNREKGMEGIGLREGKGWERDGIG